MLLQARTLRQLIEAADALGHDRARVLDGVSLPGVADKSQLISWRDVMRTCENLDEIVAGDVQKLRDIGMKLNHSPSYDFAAKLGRSVVSMRAFYSLAIDWIARINFPHLRFHLRFAGDRMFIHTAIPSGYDACKSFLEVHSGAAIGLPMVVGLPPCEVIGADITDRVAELELRLPKDATLLGAGRRALSKWFSGRTREDVLDAQRQILYEGLEATQRANLELRNVLENLPDLVVIHVEGRIVFANQTFVRTLGWSSADELVGRLLVDSVDPRTHPMYFARMARTAGTPGLPELTEAWLVTKSGDPILVEVAPPQPVMFEGAAARLVVGRDIVERDRLKQQLATQDRLASLGLLAAGVAHEVNNPLGYLLNNIEIARRQLASLGPGADMARDALQVALEGVDRIRFIVRELLLLARAEPTPVASTDLPSAIESTLALARVEITRTARLVIELEPVPPIRGSVPRIAQIVLNLVLNALEAMRSGEPELNELVVRVKRADDNHVVLEIADNGLGVSPKDVGRVFDPFFTTKSAGRGTGLGLAITQRLVAELDGEISFTSEPGKGTTFRVMFQLFEEPVAKSGTKATRSLER